MSWLVEPKMESHCFRSHEYGWIAERSRDFADLGPGQDLKSREERPPICRVKHSSTIKAWNLKSTRKLITKCPLSLAPFSNFLFIEFLGGTSLGTLTFFLENLLTGWHLELLGRYQSWYSNLILYLELLGGVPVKKTTLYFNQVAQKLFPDFASVTNSSDGLIFIKRRALF